ncbi:MAG TPA: STAS domain-containing protein, partial [Spirochaetota bacterium]|nr:STAS domain-containing protein [Spirochaetota bacterium]
HGDKLLEIMTDVLYNPTFPKEEFEKVRKRTASNLASSKTNPEAIAIKLKDCTYIDSSAIISFVRFMNLARKNKIDIVYYGLNDNIVRIFSISKLDTYLNVLSEEEFLEQYSRK